MSGTAAKTHWKKAMKFTLALFFRGFNASKCKTAAKLAVARIKLLRNKRQVVVRQMRRDIALLLQSGQDATARVRVEHVMREQNIMAANEFIELFCELIVSRLPIIVKQRDCPADLKEGISSLIFAAPRCSEIPELVALRDIFEKKYGKDFVAAATDLRPSCGVNRMLIDKLSVRTPTGELKLKIMKEIAKEYQVEWDPTESETELLKPPETLIEGPNTFVSASSLPVKPTSRRQSLEPDNPSTRYSDSGKRNNPVQYEDTQSAAQAAAESAKQALAAAEAAAYLASKDTNQVNQSYGRNNSVNGSRANRISANEEFTKNNQKFHRRHSYNAPSTNSGVRFDDSDFDEEGEAEMDDPTVMDLQHKERRRHSYNNPQVNSSVKFDESDCDEEEIEMEQPPNRPAPQIPGSANLKQGHRVHPKLPDYDALAARFEALKNRKSLD